jgi:hypothetical protein
MKGNHKDKKLNLRSIQADILNGQTMSSLERAKNGLPVAEFFPLITWAMTATKNGKLVSYKLRDALFPKNIANLKSRSLLSCTTLSREIYWASALILANSKRVGRYLELSSLLEVSLVGEDGPACFRVLDLIEAEFGHSIWLIESRIAVLQYFEGVESQKKYVAELKLNAQSNVPWYAVTISKRNEEPTTFFRYVNQTLETISDVEGDRFQAHLKYQAIGMLSREIDDLLGVLHYETDGALIDIYNACFSVIGVCVIDSCNLDRIAAVDCLVKLASKVPDDRLKRLLFIAEELDYPAQEAFSEIALIDSLTPINDAKAIEFSKVKVDWPLAWKTSATRLAQQDAVLGEGHGLQGKITGALCQILAKGTAAEDVLSNTLKLCLNFRWMSFSSTLARILMQETSSEPVLQVDEALEQFVNSKYLDPELIGALPKNLRQAYARAVSEAYLGASYTRAQIWAAGLDDVLDIQSSRITEGAQLLLATQKAYYLADYAAVIKNGLNVISLPDVRHRRLASRLVASGYKKLGLTAELIDFVAETVVSDLGALDLMPISDCVTLLNKEVCKQLASKISVPIIFSLNSRNYDDKFEKELSYAYEDFLIAHGWERPSQLMEMVENLDKSQLVYYLRYVCVPKIIKVSSEFDGSIAVQNERLAVCSILLDLDPFNAEAYEAEIREITRAQAIRRGVRHVEQSKMSIDVPALRKWADKKLKESFLRYRAMVKAGIVPSEKFEEAYIQLLADGKPIPSEFLQVPADEAGTLFREIVRQILSEATVNPMHGLDCYLSMRIRHGALSGQLRGPLELENIITKLKTGSSSYASNDYWLSRLENLSQPLRDQIDLSLCIFSARYDHLIETITDDLIQIKSSEKPKGLFDVYISVLDLRLLASSINGDTEFDRFFDSFVNIFWRSIEFCLKEVRSAIENVLKPQINEIFQTLQKSIDEVSNSNHTAELGRAIRTAHTNSLQALEQVEDWFKLPTPRAEPFFEIEELIDVGLQCVQRIHKDFSPVITKSIAELPPIANALTMFSDIFFILFDNARRYANAGKSPSISILIERDGPDSVVLSVVNEVVSSEGFSTASARVDSIKSSIASGDYHESVNSEGGTGLIKLKKIIGASQFLEFGYVDSDKFSVSFKLRLREISI